ncbi:carboxypeptidase regulatory-like domain-containing protein, partial [Hallella bergensis]|uniref:carboxypeptidase regulatory-like domain-containing protein n=1 Tax=Hallella bergensis TaxID=242750 RepID=UPI0039909C39
MVILFIALLLDCASLSAQQYRGKVCDAESGQPLVGATVQLFSRRNVFISGALTDADGHFSVQAKGDSVARVTVTYIGYTRFTRQEAGKLPTELGT